MAEYISVEQAKGISGLRLVLSPGVPGPWSEAAKGIFHVKKIPYIRVRQEIGRPDHALQEWTAQGSAPVAVWSDERPRSTWIEQLYLAERLAPTPPLIPVNIEDRALMVGYCNELCGEHGFGWSKRLLLRRAANFSSALSSRLWTFTGPRSPPSSSRCPTNCVRCLSRSARPTPTPTQ